MISFKPNEKCIALNAANRIYCFFLYHGDELSQVITWLKTIYVILRHIIHLIEIVGADKVLVWHDALNRRHNKFIA